MRPILLGDVSFYIWCIILIFSQKKTEWCVILSTPAPRCVSERDENIFSKEYYAARSMSCSPVVCEKKMWTSEYHAARIFFFPVVCGKEMMTSDYYAARSMSCSPVVCEKEMWTSECYAARQFLFPPLCAGKRWWHQNITQREVCFCFPLCVRKRCGDIRIFCERGVDTRYAESERGVDTRYGP